MRGCEIQREAKGELEIVHLSGSMDAYSFPRLEEILNELRDQNRNRVILECSGLDYISSAALGAFIGFARRAHEQNGDLKLVSVSPKIMNIIELLGFHKILEIAADVPAAITIFND
jgi:anti-sigma B factor antagonist